jgi:MraZ protein
MANVGINELIYYTATFRYGVDEKRRVQIPAKWRSSEPDAEFTLILWPNGLQPDACLLVLPPAKMAALVDKIQAMPFADPTAQSLRRLIGGQSASATVDKAGRICLPDDMAKRVGIGKEAMMVGMLDRFAIWNPERYETVKAGDAVLLPEAFKLI